MTRIICLWEAPRSRGTSISFALFHGLKDGGFNCEFRDEPLHRRHLRQIEDQQGIVARDAYLQDVKAPKGQAADFIIQKEQAKWLFDQRTKDSIGTDLDWIKAYNNVILFRDAREMVTSHQRKLDIEGRVLDMESVGIEQLYNVFQFLTASNQHFIAIDTNELLVDPERGMQRLCEQLGVEFSEGMVKWEKPDIQPPIWGPHWYEDIMNSNGLRPYRPLAENSSSPKNLTPLITEAERFIERMRPGRLRFDSSADTSVGRPQRPSQPPNQQLGVAVVSSQGCGSS